MASITKKSRANVYMRSTTERKPVYFFLDPEPDTVPVTLFMPSSLRIEEIDGQRWIICPNGAKTREINAGICNKKPYIVYTDTASGKQRRADCEVLNPHSHMKIIAYRHNDGSGWSLSKGQNMTAQELYLPAWAKLIEEGHERYIETPSTADGTIRVFSDYSKAFIPSEGDKHYKFHSFGHNGVPVLEYGNDRRHCYYVEDTDIYEPLPATQETIRLDEDLWRTDYLRRTRNGASIIKRTYSNTPPTAK